MKRILIIRSGAIGDTLLLLSFFQHLERLNPGVELRLVGKSERIKLVATQLCSIKVHDLDTDFSWLYAEQEYLPEQWKDVIDSQDWIIHFSADPVGVAHKNLKKSRCPKISCVLAIPSIDYKAHTIFYPFDELEVTHSRKAIIERPHTWMSIDTNVMAKNERKLFQSTLERPPVILSPGAGSPSKRWPLPDWKKLVELIIQKTYFDILIVTGPAEDPSEIRSLTRNFSSRVNNLHCPNFPLLAELIRVCVAFVGNDSGLTHLAAMTGIPTFALFGPSNPCRWGPVGAKALVFWGSTLYRYPEWLENEVEPHLKALESISPELIMDEFVGNPFIAI